MNKILLATVSAFALVGVAAAPTLAQDSNANVTIVKPEGSMEQAGEHAKQAAEQTGEAVKDAAAATADAAGDAAQATKDAAGDAAQTVKNAADATGDAVKDAADATADAAEKAVEETKDAASAAATTVKRSAEDFYADFKPSELETTVPEGEWLSSALMNEAVKTPDGDNIADTESLVLTSDGQVTHVVIGFGGFLGLGEKRVMLPWEAFTINPETQVFTVKLTEEQIEAMPEFEQKAKDDK